MPNDAVAYLLLALDLFVVAAVLTAPLLLLLWCVGRVRGRTAHTGRHSSGAHDPDVAAGERVLRRCEACGVLWKGLPGEDVSKAGLRLRRRVRRRTRAQEKDTPAWARRRGWNRCPSCLSTKVRTSSAGRR